MAHGRSRSFAIFIVLCSIIAFAQRPKAPSKVGSPVGSQDKVTLETVLNKMDATAATFTSCKAQLEKRHYTAVLKETDLQEGVVYVRKKGTSSTEVFIDIMKPSPRKMLFSEGQIQVYDPGFDQVTRKKVGSHQGAVESFFALGFGGSGHALLTNFTVKYDGLEDIGTVSAAKLELVPKQPDFSKLFNKVLLWVDLKTGVSVQQQFFEPQSGDYDITTYSDLVVNKTIPDSVFKLKTTKKTTFESL